MVLSASCVPIPGSGVFEGLAFWPQWILLETENQGGSLRTLGSQAPESCRPFLSHPPFPGAPPGTSAACSEPQIPPPSVRTLFLL